MKSLSEACIEDHGEDTKECRLLHWKTWAQYLTPQFTGFMALGN